jgi:hypothetical protein
MEEPEREKGSKDQLILIQQGRSFQDDMIDDALLKSLVKNSQLMSEDFMKNKFKNAQIAVTSNQVRFTLTNPSTKEFARRRKVPVICWKERAP